jgi:hypothetical protein
MQSVCDYLRIDYIINVTYSPFLYSITVTSIMSAKVHTITTAEIDPINILSLIFISESSVKSMPVSIKEDFYGYCNNAIYINYIVYYYWVILT